MLVNFSSNCWRKWSWPTCRLFLAQSSRLGSERGYMSSVPGIRLVAAVVTAVRSAVDGTGPVSLGAGLTLT